MCIRLQEVLDCGGLNNLYLLSKLTYEDFFVGNRFKRCIDVERSANVFLGYDNYSAIRKLGTPCNYSGIGEQEIENSLITIVPLKIFLGILKNRYVN
jgi:hypothetical protein